jgi:hypothetical protein
MQMAQTTYQMQLVWVPIYTPSALQIGGPRLSLTVTILAKGRCFSDLRLKVFVHVAVWIRYLNKLILRGATVGGPSSSEGPQKHDLTMFSKCNVWAGTFGLGLKAYTMWKAWSWRRLVLLRSYAQGSFGSMVEKGTDLKGQRLSGPHWVVHKSIVNMKDMNVNLHRLRSVPINRWIVPPYGSRWLVFICASRLDFLPSVKPKVQM